MARLCRLRAFEPDAAQTHHGHRTKVKTPRPLKLASNRTGGFGLSRRGLLASRAR